MSDRLWVGAKVTLSYYKTNGVDSNGTQHKAKVK